jgi:hypothetical protein
MLRTISKLQDYCYELAKLAICFFGLFAVFCIEINVKSLIIYVSLHLFLKYLTIQLHKPLF